MMEGDKNIGGVCGCKLLKIIKNISKLIIFKLIIDKDMGLKVESIIDGKSK